jgi:hypothetical protein
MVIRGGTGIGTQKNSRKRLVSAVLKKGQKAAV